MCNPQAFAAAAPLQNQTPLAHPTFAPCPLTHALLQTCFLPPTGTCHVNPPTCGQVGSPCCAADGMGSPYGCMKGALGYRCDSSNTCQKCPPDWKTKFAAGSWDAIVCGRTAM